ncbi:MAG: helix-turn-helix domain-containing protein [Nitrospirota bacterium]
MSGNTARKEKETAATSMREAVSQLERELILRSLEAANGSQSEAARRLGVSERVLRYKMKKYRIIRSTKVSFVDKNV